MNQVLPRRPASRSVCRPGRHCALLLWPSGPATPPASLSSPPNCWRCPRMHPLSPKTQNSWPRAGGSGVPSSGQRRLPPPRTAPPGTGVPLPPRNGQSVPGVAPRWLLGPAHGLPRVAPLTGARARLTRPHGTRRSAVRGAYFSKDWSDGHHSHFLLLGVHSLPSTAPRPLLLTLEPSANCEELGS